MGGLSNTARNLIAQMIAGEAYTAFNNANAYLGVGNSSTAYSAAHTDLQGASKTRKAMDTGYPQRTDNAITYRSTFTTAEANYDWLEWGVFNDPAAGAMLCRKADNQGTKTSDYSWRLTSVVTMAIP